MLAFRLLRHSILQLTGNLGAALTLSVLPLLLAALGIGIGVVARLVLAGGNPSGIAFGAVMIAIAATFILAIVVLAASWHRHVLLEERPQVFRSIGRSEARYFWAAVRMTLVIMLIVFLPLILIVALTSALNGSVYVTMLASLIIGIAVAIIGLRLGTGLAGAAIGAEKPLTTGWKATESHLGTLLLLAVFSQILQTILNLASQIPGLVGLVATLLAAWLGALLSLSLITTLWGHFVEGRALR
ncbi:hypothetical protein [Paracoccus hibiscisoli]|uniref:Glycerophosphoryl diester phosphodiesterase membrane domain-containing protein n=1 Tax=Paracoccus hibiscisoli TaxID=2023261 RepID=A0A4U0QXQ1_9RHOB|nr:hypothetical protein [Paracoccus hibiscisoli]TJZ86640.1 hypothetical protein FA740_03340 [Paracoccus hibiscisoli]